MKQYCILLVDDDINNLELLVERLLREYRIIMANNGRDALQIARKEIPDLIITDWDMPVMNGIEMIKALKGDNTTQEIPVIMTTGIKLTSFDLETALNAGAIDYLRKPIDDIELIARIRSAIRFSENRKTIEKQKQILENQKVQLNKALDELIEKKNSYELLVQHSPLGIAFLSTKGVIKSCNKAFTSIFKPCKFNLQESVNWIDKLAYDYYSILSNFNQAINKISTVEFELEINCSGATANLHIYYSPVLNRQQQVIGVLCIVNDITERKISETELMKFKKAVEQTAASVLITDKNAIIEYVNPAFSKITGYSFDEAVGKNPRFLKPDDRPQHVIEDFWNTLKNKKVWRGELENKKKNNEHYWERILAAPIINENNEVTNYIAVKYDITDEIKNNRRLEELNATKDKFFSIIAHDLKNPFNTILSYAELLQKNHSEITPDQLESWSNKLYSSSLFAYNLLVNLLEWSRSQMHHIPYEPNDYFLKGIVIETITSLLEIAKKKQIQLKETIQKNIWVFADENMLRTILRNLVSNALKFSNKGDTVSVEATTGSNMVTIAVKDTGIGMDKETMDKLFRSDIHFTTQGTRNEPGTGLGLILCKEFVDKHNGKIRVESNVDKGSIFSFTIPISKKNVKNDKKQKIKFETVYSELETPKLPGFYLSDQVAHHLPQITKELESYYLPYLKQVRSNSNMQDIKDFAEELATFAEKYHFIYLQNYCKKLIKNIKLFDIEEIEDSLNLLPEFLKHLKEIQ